MKEEAKLPYGGAVFSFSTMEEFYQHQEQAETAANANVVPAQREITWGDYVIRLVPDLVVWGRIYTFEEIVAKEAELGAKEDELERTKLRLRAFYDRGYRYGWWSSSVDPGEPGDAHISTLWRIPREDYEKARDNAWLLWPELAHRLHAEFVQATNEETMEGKDGGDSTPAG